MNNGLSPFQTYLERQMRLSGYKSRSALARAMDTGASTVNSWFSRNATPDAENFRKLGKALGRPVVELLYHAGFIPEEEMKEIRGGVPPSPLPASLIQQLEQLPRDLDPAVERIALQLQEALADPQGFAERNAIDLAGLR